MAAKHRKERKEMEKSKKTDLTEDHQGRKVGT
jgi:hypothetical protein